MKKIFMVIMAAMLVVSVTTAYGANFTPQTLKLSAPSNVSYNFDGKPLSIPVTVTGTPANVTFLVYTKGKASSIRKITNGFLGWHYMNNLDTCVYFSGPFSMGKGSNVYTWDGKGKDKTNLVPAGDYTYYFFAFDDKSPRIPVTIAFNMPTSALPLQEKGPDGKALANPYFVAHPSSYAKWIIGGDPNDKTLLETTSTTIPSGWTQHGRGPIAFLPTDFRYFFNYVANVNSKLMGIAKWQWVPNGAGVLQTAWGDNGFSTYSGAGYASSAGVVSDGLNLYTGEFNTGNVAVSSFFIYDFDSSISKKIDLTSWWSNPDNFKAGGQMNGGPGIYYERNGYIFLSNMPSCMLQMVNPLAETDTDFYLWTNRNGDYVFDKNFTPSSTKAWVCNDFNTGPYNYNNVVDTNLFAIGPTFDLGAVSFGLLGPDGTGIGYFSYSGETAQQKYGNAICSNGSPYDGIYTTVNDATAIQSGIWYVAQNSIKGTISNNIGVEEAAPAAFSVSQNAPNPFNPATTISFTLAKAGKVKVDIFNTAGQKVDTVVNTTMNAGSHTATWNASKFSAGVYFYTVTSGDFSRTMKMTLLK
jgi:hypothetical protein